MIGIALGWKYDNASGICTRKGKITKWPESLGVQPNEAEVVTIVAEYEAHKATVSHVEPRKKKYKNKADPLFMEWQYLKETADPGADAARTKWINEVAKIRLEHPKG